MPPRHPNPKALEAPPPGTSSDHCSPSRRTHRSTNASGDNAQSTGKLTPLHFEKGEFIAQTRQEAFRIMAEKLGCPLDGFQQEYVRHYRDAFRVLKQRLPQLGEGRQRFAPPF